MLPESSQAAQKYLNIYQNRFALILISYYFIMILHFLLQHISFIHNIKSYE